MVLSIFRVIVLTASVVFSIIVLGLAADLTSLTEEFYDGYFTFAALAIATACLTLVSLPILLIIDILRRGAFTSMVVVELSWLAVLWILWLATGSDVASVNGFGNCDYINSDLNTACHEFNAVEGFAFLNFIILFCYSVVLLVFSIIGSSRGHRVWTNSVKEAPFLAPVAGVGAAAAAAEPKVEPQYTGTTQQGHPTQSPAPTGYPAQNVPNGAHSPYAQV